MEYKTMSMIVFSSFLLVSLVKASTSGGLILNNITGPEERPCSLSDYTHKAYCERVNVNLTCSNGLSYVWLTSVRYDITYLRLSEWPGECINVERLQKNFPQLRNLDISNSTTLRYFKGHFDDSSKIQKISIHNLTHLWELPGNVVERMTQLRELDLRNNMLRHMKANLLRGPPQLEQVYLGGNNWDCSDGGLDWLAMENENGTTRRKVVDYYDLICHQRLHRGKPLHIVMDIIRVVRKTCPDPCSCALTHVVSDQQGNVIPLITVDCSRKQLENPPDSLPPSTTTLRLEGNKLSNIRQLVQSPKYSKLMDLYLDNNSIQAVKELEGSEWFTSFRVLSLRGNMLKQIPVFAFDKAFQGNNNILHVFLGLNPWRCDCHFIPRFQGLLLKYKRVIRDLKDIRCAKSDDKSTSLVQISTMSLGSVCSSDVKMPISTINIINLVLFILLISVIGKFLYDWHRFRTTGKLPWISSVMP